jgi:hypothetical protein
MTIGECKICVGERWVCETHRDKRFSHDGCPGPGIPCECNPDERMPPGFLAHCERPESPARKLMRRTLRA